MLQQFELAVLCCAPSECDMVVILPKGPGGQGEICFDAVCWRGV